MGDVVRVDVADGVATVSLDRPDKLNAMSVEVFRGLAEAGRRVAADPDVRAVVIRGEGRAFSSGLDLSSFATYGEANAPELASSVIPTAQEGFRVWGRVAKPVVAAVRGYALGAGFQLALAADLRIAATDAVFGMLEVTYGLVPDLGGTQRLPAIVGPARAKELIWTARRLSASEALEWGLANRVVSPDEVDVTANQLAADLARRPPIPLAHAKRLVDLAGKVSVEQGMDEEAHSQLVCLLSEDVREAVAAALEKRPGAYKGR